MTDSRPNSAKFKLTRVPLGDWSRTEYLYIQLHSELLFAVARLPVVACPIIDDSAQYISYCQYFATEDAANEEPPEEAGSGIVKGLGAFIDKRDKLCGAIMWALRQMRMKEIKNSDTSDFRYVDVSPAMLQQYRQIRGRLGFGTYVHDPTLWPELWSFLQDAARNQFPEFSGDATQADPTQDVDTNADVDIDVDYAPIVGPVPTNDLADTSNHDSADKDEMSDADADADTDTDTDTEDDDTDEDDAEDDANPRTTRPGSDEFAKETGRIRCTEYAKETGERCKRQAKTENEDRRSWKCHNHDPVRKQQILTDRLTRNRARKAGKAGKKDEAAKPKQQKKQRKAGK